MLNMERSRIEARTLDRTRLVMSQIDGALRADLGALSVFAGGPTVRAGTGVAESGGECARRQTV